MSNHQEGHFTVAIDGIRYTPDTQTKASSETYWQNVLKDARTKRKVPLCCCKSESENQLAIRMIQGKRVHYFLARYPDQGLAHHPNCRFYSNSKLSGLQGYTKNVVEEIDGEYKIKLDLGFHVGELSVAPKKEKIDSEKGSPSVRKPSMQLLGLLHFLFTLGRLNVWYPKMKNRRTWAVIARTMSEEATKIKCGTAMLSEQLLVGIKVDINYPAGATPPANDSWKENREQLKLRNEKLVEEGKKNKTRLVVVGQLKKHTDVTKNDAQLPKWLPLQQSDGLPYMTMDAAMWDLAEKRFPQAWAAWKRGERACVIARLEYSSEPRFTGAKNPKGWLVVDLALQALNDAFVPVESSYERQVADLLVAQDRVFEKPLRYDADKDEVFPDFILLDTDIPKYPMEVFGRTDEKYEKRAKEKEIYYTQHFGGNWWKWKAATEQNIPAFPNATRRET